MNKFKQAGWSAIPFAIALLMAFATGIFQETLFSNQSVASIGVFSLIGTYCAFGVGGLVESRTGANANRWLFMIPAASACYGIVALMMTQQRGLFTSPLLSAFVAFICWPGANTVVHRALREH